MTTENPLGFFPVFLPLCFFHSQSIYSNGFELHPLYYNERRYLTELDSRRCAGYEEVVQQDIPESLMA
jgi:hypothetical protein